MSIPKRWVLSPRDCQAHKLVPAGDHSREVLKALGGHLRPTGMPRYELPPGRGH